MRAVNETAAPPAYGVVLGHGGMATGLVDAVHRIAGVEGNVLIALSNEGKGPEALRDELARTAGPGPALVFTDMHSGSCALAARLVCRSRESAVVCGVNLPMLLEFVFNRELPLDQLVPRLVERGRAAVTAHLPNADSPVPG
ncbi:MAG: hypothetical protein OXI46_04875 [Gemmatimonadota bacterium]|nr:hypothetical protein [Gemmatimonadota bacterium]